jgi:hypothetical protein
MPLDVKYVTQVYFAHYSGRTALTSISEFSETAKSE